MPLPNEAIIAAAGGGKTTRIVQRALTAPAERSAMITYTQNNTEETERKIYAENRCMPGHIEVRSWYSFLLRECVRPYQNSMYSRHIRGMNWVQGRSDPYAAQKNIARFYFANGAYIYSDKVSQFACECNKAANGAVIRRLEQRFDRIYIDEIQDMAGYDLELIELLLKSGIRITMVGDHRQSTFKTNNAAKNKAYGGFNIIAKLRQWQKVGLCSVSYEVETHRCNQAIADLADSLFPDEPGTVSRNERVTGHDGIFLISPGGVEDYIRKYRPQVLRLDKKTDCGKLPAKNFGDSKGLTFDRVLVFPHKLGQRWLESGDNKHVQGSLTKLYVGVTRARYSVTFVHDGACGLKGAVRHSLG